MAKINIKTKNGGVINIEGTPSEVKELTSYFGYLVLHKDHVSKKTLTHSKIKNKIRQSKPTPTSLIGDLIDGGFFKKPIELSAVKTALEEHGHYYPITTLSPVMLRFVRSRQLRRIKQNKRWLYVG